ncbi:MAG: flagellar motor protein MotD [Sphingobacteriia bacterium]|nr:flagellar motor protein MotD [Sphingobacteriia bacterium]NCC38983.1 flagellar motor protein MotD [Gammaproteobacteria bacterium]
MTRRRRGRIRKYGRWRGPTSYEYEDLNRWLISYADFITLMFAFFVVLFAMSSIDETKVRALSGSFSSAFRGGGLLEGRDGIIPAVQTIKPSPLIIPMPSEDEVLIREASDRMRRMAREIRQVLSPLIQDGKISVGDNDSGIQIDISSNLLFKAGQADLDPLALSPLRLLAQVLSEASFPIKVEGHTDSTPISNARFPSNWELSAGRAAQVVRVFIESGLDAGRLNVAGYADQRPVGDNATPEGRERNRRVAIIIEMPTIKRSASSLGLINPIDPGSPLSPVGIQAPVKPAQEP